MTQPFLTDFDPTTPAPVIINGAPPAVRRSGGKHWAITAGLVLAGIAVAVGGTAAYMADAGKTKTEKAVAAATAEFTQKLNVKDSVINGQDSKLDSAEASLNDAAITFDAAANVQDKTCTLLDALDPFYPGDMAETITLCESHEDTLRGWSADMSAAADRAGQ
jgi:hypothetical protein